MAPLPTILVAGGGNLHVRLLEPFPASTCTIAHAESLPEAIDGAADASLVVVDARLGGRGVDLCRRLRSDAVTSHIPLVLVVANRTEHLQAVCDQRVVATDFLGLIHSIHELCPELDQHAPGGPGDDDLPDDGFFDESPTTVLFRRPEAEPGQAAEWPSPPPTRPPRQDLLEFAQIYSGYMSSLLEALEAPSMLSAGELSRLRSMSTLTIDGTEQHMTFLQTAITEALVSKDLDRMKLLSSAKNSIYDKVQQMRGLVAKLPGDEPAPAVTKSGAPVGTPRKSELTRAAEAKAASEAAAAASSKAAQRAVRTQTRQKQEPRAAPPRGKSQARRDDGGRRRTLLLAALIVVVVGAAVTFILSSRGPAASESPGKKNQPPRMKWVQIEQTGPVIVARGEAEDLEQDPIVFMFRWLVNGNEVVGERTARLQAGAFRAGDTVQVEIRPSDTHQIGAPLPSLPLVAKPTEPPTPSPAPGPAAPAVPPPGPAAVDARR